MTATFTSLSVADVSAYGGLQNALNRGAINERMLGKGISETEAGTMLAKVPIEALQLDKNGKVGKSTGSATVIKRRSCCCCSPFPSCSTPRHGPGNH